MRFDDRLRTALAQPGDTDSNALVTWRQLVDILARHPRHYSQSEAAAGIERLHLLSGRLSEQSKVAGLNALRGRLHSPPLVALFSGQSPNVAAAAIASAELADAEWAELIPELSSRARGYLRNRRDLGPKAESALDRWRSADFRLGAPSSDIGAAPAEEAPSAVASAGGEAETVEAAANEDVADTDIGGQQSSGEAVSEKSRPSSSISELLARIEGFRRNRARHEGHALPQDQEWAFPERIESFPFETDDNGVITDARDVPRGALVGITIAEPAFEDLPGPDAYAAAAFGQRMPIRDARMRLLGAHSIAGEWRFSGEPVFDDRSGRFRGYRGDMRRPMESEDAAMAARSQIEAEQLQQLLHELRTPLNAIIGFGEIIEQQLFGPVSADYRALATDILEDARRLAAGFDDLSLAAKLDRGGFDAREGTTHAGWLFDRLGQRLGPITQNRALDLDLTKSLSISEFALAQSDVERIFSRLLSAILMAAGIGEKIEGTLETVAAAHPYNRFELRLPEALRAKDEAALLQAGSGPDGKRADAPLLGLGFSLRLVRNLARSSGGDLHFLNGDLVLQLPAVPTQGSAHG